MTMINEAGAGHPLPASNGGESAISQLFQPALREAEARHLRLEEEVAGLLAQVSQLRHENDDLRFERDLYRQQVLEAHRGDLGPLTDEERREADESGLTLQQFVEELRRSGAKT